jgi:tetratricopeptide (TPR) repeat protein
MNNTWITSIRRSELLPAAVFLALLCLAILSYWPGLSGAFLFDDFPNLKELGAYGGVRDLDSLRLYLFSGFAGPTGRPLSLLSFLINDYTWPSVAWGFKYTNLLIHALNGLVLFWLTYRIALSHLAEDRRTEAAWLAAISAGLWLLHPLHVSTTLYVVQRMAQLATLFVLAGLLGYVYWRARLAAAPRAALIGMTLSICLATLAAVLSKENGVLLPALALTIELTLFSGRDDSRALRVWRGLVLWLPTLAVAGYLARSAYRIGASRLLERGYTIGERVLTESRIVLEYLQHLLLPSIKSRGLFSDAIPLSTGIVHPPATLLALAILGALVIAAVVVRRRWPLFSLAVLFFLVGQVVESTVIPLELYFEHRNYLPSVFLFLPLAAGAVWAYRRMPRIVPWGIAGVILLMAGMTWQRTDLWGRPADLMLAWARDNPTSARAQLSGARVLAERGAIGQAIRELQGAEARIPDSLAVRMQRFLLLDAVGVSNKEDFAQLLAAARRLPFENEVLPALKRLTQRAVSDTSKGLSVSDMQALLGALQANPSYRDSRFSARLIPHLEGKLYLAEGRPEAAEGSFELALKRQHNVEAGLMEVALLASHHYFEEALRHLARARKVLARQAGSTLKRPRTEYESEIARLDAVIKDDLQSARARAGHG